MAADEAGEKTEQPTPRRRQEAAEQGNVPRSTDLTAAIVLLGGLLLLNSFGPRMLERTLILTRELGDAPPVRPDELHSPTWRAALVLAEVCVPLLLLLMVVAAGGALLQSRPVLAWKKVGFKPENLRLDRGVRKLFSTESLVRGLMALLKVSIVAAVAWWTIRADIAALLATGALSAGDALMAGGAMTFKLALRLAMVLLVLGLIDYFYQRRRLEQQLKMTKQEVREELKRMEGDPQIKMRRRQVQLRLAMQRLNVDVPRADVVVTNPTEYAVALRYDEASMRAPRVIAKGKDLLAERIRAIAMQHRIPIVQRPPLARALYATLDVGQEVPPQFYRAIAELLAYVYQLSGRAAG